MNIKLLFITTITSVFLIGCVGKSSALQSAVWNGYSVKVEKYLDSGADVNEQRDGTTLLHIAALNNRHLIAQQLIAKGAMVNTKDKNGGTPLHVAGPLGHDKIVELLINMCRTELSNIIRKIQRQSAIRFSSFIPTVQNSRTPPQKRGKDSFRIKS